VTSTDRIASFGPFRLFPEQMLLMEKENPVRLGSRALELLIALTERAGELVSKNELMNRVWPDTTVDENSLKFHICSLRRALGDGQPGRRYLATVHGRGYTFVAPVEFSTAAEPITPPDAVVDRKHNLPGLHTRALGRGETVSALLDRLSRQRFITIVGEGGVGKTTVALALAEALIGTYEHGIWFVDLAPLSDEHFVVGAVASALGLTTHSDNPIPDLIAHLRLRRVLILLDTCDHAVGAVAALAEKVLAAAPQVHIVATSREPLHAQGEHVHRLPPLGVPPNPSGMTASDALSFPSIQLFVERVGAMLEGFELENADAPIVAAICRKLGGLPLALELAASRVHAFGVRQLWLLLDSQLGVLNYGKRSARPRHQTLASALDWSYEFLPEVERALLRRLSVFRSGFSLESARAVASVADSDLANDLANLVTKSLVAADVGCTNVQYRLPDTLRVYAAQKLAESGELEQYARRHAEHQKNLFEQARAEWKTERTEEWLATHARHIDDIRAALDWAFSPKGDAVLGVALTVSAVPLWVQLSLVSECRGRVEQALAALRPTEDERRKMRLYAALDWSRFFLTASVQGTGFAWNIALELAEWLGDADYSLRALWGLWAGRLNSGDFPAALELATKFRNVATTGADPADLPVGDRMVGATLHLLGDQRGARQRIEPLLSHFASRDYHSDVVRFQFDQSTTANITIARVLWLQGFADQAMRTVKDSIDHALSINHTLSLCNALAQAACPVAFLAGDLSAAEWYTTMLVDRAEQHALEVWRIYGNCFRAQLLIQRGDVDAGLRLLGPAVDELRKAGFAQYLTPFLIVLAEGLARSGRILRGLDAIEEAFGRSEQNQEGWCFAEILRVQGELILRTHAPRSAAEAEEHFLQSIDSARRQQTPSWELRTAMSIAELWRGCDKPAAAEQLLSSVYNKFSEGFETNDLKRARALIEQLRNT
jgi:predicted ATPase/DNA-binding winged helix-turn-helix (wHTH) protein